MKFIIARCCSWSDPSPPCEGTSSEPIVYFPGTPSECVQVHWTRSFPDISALLQFIRDQGGRVTISQLAGLGRPDLLALEIAHDHCCD